MKNTLCSPVGFLPSETITSVPNQDLKDWKLKKKYLLLSWQALAVWANETGWKNNAFSSCHCKKNTQFSERERRYEVCTGIPCSLTMNPFFYISKNEFKIQEWLSGKKPLLRWREVWVKALHCMWTPQDEGKMEESQQCRKVFGLGFHISFSWTLTFNLAGKAGEFCNSKHWSCGIITPWNI